MLELHYGLLLAQLINFGILYYLFHRFIGRKLTAGIAKRQAELEKLRLAEEHYKEKMQLAEQEKQSLLLAAKKSSEALLEESRYIAKLKAEAILKEAHDNALAVLEGGKRELEKERISMLGQVKSHIVDMSLRLNKKMFDTPNTSKEFLEKEVEKL
ncbi:ATP synthase F0 subunit B [Candidatus Gracilibacteria bacterium]|nr:ATP synthase F0 subunit B [Candidatus Gracilibacteria bacterium]